MSFLSAFISVHLRFLSDFDFLRSILLIQLRSDRFGLFAIAADDRELMFALLAVPDGVFAANTHRDADFADVLWHFDAHYRAAPTGTSPSTCVGVSATTFSKTMSVVIPSASPS